MIKTIGIAFIVGLVTGTVLGLLLKSVPALNELIPAGWHGAVVGGLAGAAAAMAGSMSHSTKKSD